MIPSSDPGHTRFDRRHLDARAVEAARQRSLPGRSRFTAVADRLHVWMPPSRFTRIRTVRRDVAAAHAVPERDGALKLGQDSIAELG